MIKCSKALGEIIERRKRYCTPSEMETINVAHGKLILLEEMEEQGRLIILPCKVGDMVYYRRGRDIIGDTVDSIIIDNGTRYVELNCGRKTFWLEEFGTRVFTSYTDAEDAMKGEREDV